ncbi:putative uncharacterized protein DDB_G0282133 isoform X2 [Chelonus insularis]|uniref:putative uncharacterized protein DDB_G0282133 isoform X2 n=1 Tax=Chelonus insularis TaxID=460826 RepID=UPI00158A8167|nr:putative uncharacterized protein DDB_G0282133 isoform X2 [Chelonus insularis]
MNNDSGNESSECVDQVKLNEIILIENDGTLSQKECHETKTIYHSESIMVENNLTMEETCNGKTANQFTDATLKIESSKNDEPSPLSADNSIDDPTEEQLSFNDSLSDLEDNEELSSYFGQTPIVKHKFECCCQTCNTQRAFIRDKVQRSWHWQSQGLKIREYIRALFNAAVECPSVPNIPKYEFDETQYKQLQEIVNEFVLNYPHKLFLMLAIQAQEFVVELKIGIMQQFPSNIDIDQIAETFLTRLLNGYDVIINTAIQVSELTKLLEEKHLSKFNLTWEFFNKKLYQNYVYLYEPIIRNILPCIMRQLQKSCKKNNDGYKLLLRRYLDFVDEMMKTAKLWGETESLIDEYNVEQVTRILNTRKIDPDVWTISTIEEALKVESERTMDVPGVELGQIPFDCYFVKQLSELEATNLDNTKFVRKILDIWAKKAYQILAADYLGGHWFDYKQNLLIENSINHKNLDYYFGYQSGGALVLNSPNDSNIKIETNCSVCGDLTWVSYLVINGRTNAGLCAHPALPKKEKPVEEDPITQKIHFKRCICIYRHLAEWQVATFQGLLLFPPCSCILTIGHFTPSNLESPATSTCFCVKNDISPIKKLPDKIVKQKTLSPHEQKPSDLKTSNSAKVTSTLTQTLHSAVQTSTIPHKCNDHDNHHAKGLTNGLSSKDTTKTTESFSKIRNLKKNHKNINSNNINNTHAHNNNSSSHNCLNRRSNVEQIKRVSCNGVDGNHSDSASIGDSCSSADSSTPRESGRHCDCCYCEVFGHGVPSVASVNRNYNETRERLRQLLTKKKSKICSTASCNSTPSPIESIIISNSNSGHSENSNSNSISNNSEPKPNMLVHQFINSTDQSQKQDNRDLNTLLDFIEGNQQSINSKKDINIKKIEKKARQKQKKLEKNLKEQQEELDRKKLVELQKKTPGVTITVVDPQKPVSQKLLLNRNLPEVSILPATISHQQKHINNNENSRSCISKNSSSGGNHSNISNNSISKSNSSSSINKNNSNTKQRMTINKEIPGEKKGTRVIGINEILNSSHSAKSIKDQEKLSKMSKNTILNSQNKKPSESIMLDPQSQLSLTKKQRKKLRREMMKKLEEEKKNQEQKQHEEAESQPQIVTIKRVMESNSAEPTVTITLKGQTPAEDKVLFTLINGQTKEPVQEQQASQNSTGKKKKKKKKSQDANNQAAQQVNQIPVNQLNGVKSKVQGVKGNDKVLKDQLVNGKNKIMEQENSQKLFLTITKELTQNNTDSKSKKNKKNVENKQPLTPLQQKNNTKGKNQQHEPVENEKKLKKVNTTGQPLAEIKIQSNVNNLTNNVPSKKKNKALKQQNSNNNNTDNNNKKNNNQSEKINNKNNNKQPTVEVNSSQITQLKTTIAQQSMSKLLRTNIQQNKINEQNSNSLSSQLKDASSKINIENLRLPPGITITKVDAPVKPLPIKSTPLQKQPTNASKQATIIAAPMSANSMQSNYSSSSSQSPGNVIVVDTGKLKQDLLPDNEKGASREQSNTTSNSKKKKKKKKNNNANNTNADNNNSANGNNKSGVIVMSKKNNDLTSKYSNNEQARIVHNPGSNMVTIRNPAFGSVPKMEPLQQAAIIKLSENGMVTIRSPALQQAINAGLTPPPKPDFIVKGDFVTGNNTPKSTTQSNHIAEQKCTSNGFISSNISELRNKLSTPQCGNISSFGNIQISKVTNGQLIPENGINLKGTSVTLTKINSPETVTTSKKNNDNQQPTGNKTKKKKKKSSGTKSCGDDWNLVEMIHNPKY